MTCDSLLTSQSEQDYGVMVKSCTSRKCLDMQPNAASAYPDGPRLEMLAPTTSSVTSGSQPQAPSARLASVSVCRFCGGNNSIHIKIKVNSGFDIFLSTVKKFKLAGRWWRTPLIPVLGRQRQVDF